MIELQETGLRLREAEMGLRQSEIDLILGKNLEMLFELPPMP